jgi:ERCC4-type nuclease
MLTVDNREHDLIPLLTSLGVTHTVQQLPVADLWIGTSLAEPVEGGIIAERKSIRDLEASILDGRYREQRGRILAYCQEHKTQPLYILEGSLTHTRTLPVTTLMKYISRLTLRYQIPVIQTASLQETALLVQSLTEQWQEDPTALKRTTELVKVSDGIHVQKKANAADTFAVGCLAQCPGVSVKMAEAILAATGGTLRGVMDTQPAVLAEIKVGTRRVGPAVATRLAEMLK